VLGEFAVTADDIPLPLCSSGQRLVAFLAVHGRGQCVTRSSVAAALWADTPPQRAAARLRSVLWRLSRAVGHPMVRASGAGLALDPGVAVDLYQAEDEARSVTIAESHTERTAGYPVLATFRSDLLPTWPEDWLVLEREAFRQVRLHALEATSASLLRAGQFPAALDAALAAVQCEPLRESAHRSVIAVHLAEGNQAEALRQYQSFRRLLSAELGLPPSQAIRGLVAPLLGRPLDGPAGHGLPSQTRSGARTHDRSSRA
jgi:DNA-binding SARP family transcriptional activator